MSDTEDTASNGFPNLAYQEDVDEQLSAELAAAGIETLRLRYKSSGEARTSVMGVIEPWDFRRAWRYWIAEGPGIPVDLAERLHAEYGTEVRVGGSCVCPSPREHYHGFGVDLYHVDVTALGRGLAALAKMVREVLSKGDEEKKVTTGVESIVSVDRA